MKIKAKNYRQLEKYAQSRHEMVCRFSVSDDSWQGPLKSLDSVLDWLFGAFEPKHNVIQISLEELKRMNENETKRSVFFIKQSDGVIKQTNKNKILKLINIR